MKQHLPKKLLSLLLVVALLAGFAVPVGATGETGGIRFQQTDNSAVSGSLLTEAAEPESNEPDYEPTDMVRVSIFLEDASTLDAGFATQDIAENNSAMAYRADLQDAQDQVTATIERSLGEKLDVVWNLTLATNAISANVAYGDIAAIEKIPGVKEVVLETRYEPQETDDGAADVPNMAVSSQMTQTNLAWQSGYTGAGMRVAIIDTGLDWEHQSMDPDAFAVALAEDAGYDDMEYEEYLAAIDVMDTAEIAEKLPLLNVYERTPSITAEDLYVNLKVPFGYNYIDQGLDITHMNDSQSDHGSHVAGIATANRYIKQGDDYVSAVDNVGVVGNAPDAQVIVMKVFGRAGGAYDSDYMAAIEDAIVLGCDSVNLSLGSGNAGFTTSDNYQAIMDSLSSTNTVSVMSAGNNGYWAENASPLGYLFLDGVNYHTGGSPGSFTNSLAVASVDNDGGVGDAFSVAGQSFVYSETDYSNEPMTTLDTSAEGTGTEYEYVFVDGFGTPEDFANIDVTGKVVFCSRGETSFFEKGNAGAAAGAAATVVYNNEPGIINMDLTDYEYTAPCVSITQQAGQFIRENSTAATDAAGGTYYTGTLTISRQLGISYNESEYLTMSEFSSWGVPGDLSLKPEITAPGGSIYSLLGTSTSHNQYQLMSGTSMAAPQITGITALVKQYIEENGLSQDGITDRALAQSLMMSTAVPLKVDADTYYPVIQQGAGLANTAAATSADSYIMVDGQPDGKVKAELGDDPERSGVYSFSFDINNMDDEARVYELSADLFTQDAFVYYANANMSEDELAYYMDTLTTALAANVTWTADGQLVNSAGEMANCDFNNDGKVDENDAQALLDYVSGKSATINAAAYADIDGDGDVDTYDAHLFLNKLGKDTVTVAAGDSVKITVTMKLTDEEKAYLDTYYTSGAYVEGYVFVNALTDSEGVEGTSHSIPVLAFYGNWTDASMFDVGSYQEYATGEETRTPYLGNMETNTYAVIYGDDPDTAYYFGGNPLVPDEVYMPERNAINSERGDKISQASFAAIRNTGASRFTVTNLTTNEVLAEAFPGAVTAAYFYDNYGMWMSTGYTLNVNWAPTGMAEGESVEVALALAPEYYVADDGSVNWDALGEGAYLKTTATVDNTAPQLYDVSMSLTGKTLTVTASDNQYVAAAVLYNAAGTTPLAYTGSVADAVPGETYSYTMDISNVNGSKFLLQVCDYAMNAVTYEVELQMGEEQPLPEFIAFDLSKNYWVAFDKTADETDMNNAHAMTNDVFFAATIVDHIVFAATENGDLYVMPEEDLTNVTYVRNLGTVLTDMAYNPVDGEIYAVNADGNLVTVDKLTGEVSVVGTIGITTNTLACDEEGTFYCNLFGSGDVYAFTLDTIDAPELLVETDLSSTAYIQSMEINPNDGKLYWTSYYAFEIFGFVLGYSYFYEIDVDAASYVKYNDLWDELSCLIIPEKSSGGDWSAPTDEVSGINLSATQLTILRGSSANLSASVLPWTATDRSVTWSTSDPAIATVDANGRVTGVEKGECVITATSVLDPSVSAECVVTVDTVNATLEGVLQDEDGDPMFFSWNMETENTWTGGTALDTSLISATLDEQNNYLYVMDESSNVWAMHKVDMTTGETVENSGANAAGVPLWDMAYSKYFSTADAPLVSSIYGYYFLSPKDPMNMDSMAFNLQSRVGYLTGITSAGYEEYWDEEDQVMLDTEHIILMDDLGQIWNFWIYETDEGMSAWLNSYPSTLELDFPGYNNMENMYCSLVLGEDGNLYLSYFTGDTNEFYRLTFNAETEEYEAALLGDVGSGVWPAALYSVKSNAESSNSLPATGTMKMDAVPVSQEELAAAAQSVEMTLASVSNADNAQKDQQVEAEDAPAGGSLNAVQVSAEPVATVNKMPMELMGVGSDTDCTEKSVTLTITADNATTNGLITVDFDTDVLSFSDSKGMADFNSFAVADGKITFAYASKDAIAAGSTLATLTFTAEEEAEVDFKVTVVEDGDQKPGTEQTVTVQVPEHNYIATVVEPTCTEQGYTLYTCSNCGASYQDNYTDPTGHDWGEWTIEVAPTCVNEGTEIRTCANCGEEESRTVAATGHSFVETVVEPTCTEEGYTRHTCSVCGYSYSDNEVAALGHSFEDTVVEPTCTEIGYTVHTCSVCGYSYTDSEVRALGHSWNEWTIIKDSSCNAPGERIRTCSVCGETQSEVILPTGHTYESTVVEPTCTTSGYTRHTCLLCGMTYVTEVTDPTGHDWSDWTVETPATCTEAGVEIRTCNSCGEEETRAIPATGHDWGEWTVETEPTCTETGIEARTCNNCGEKETRVLAAIGHDWSDWTVENEPTCTEAGVEARTCGNCGEKETRLIAATGHDWSEWTVETEPTCTEVGTEVRTCANCGEEETRLIAPTDHSFEDTVVEPTCTEKGYTVHTCSVCGFSYSDTEVDALGHSWGEWTVVKDANCNAPGEQVRTCSVCGETQSEVILPSGHTYETTVIAPTCTSSGYTKHTCLLCGVTYATDVIDPLGHNWGEWVLTEEGDCFHKGVETRTCAACNETETRETELNPANCPSKAFTDLDTAAWYHESVDFVLSTGLMNGVGNEKFAPNNQMTRAMVVTVLYRLAGEPKVEGTVDFTDVPAGEYYYDALVWATENGLAMGVTETTFAPGRSITREQLVTFLYRYAQYAGLDVSGRADLTTFTDSQSVSSYAVDAFAWAVNAGIIDGVGNNTLAPRSTATRVQVAAVLMRLSRLS